MLFLPVLLHGQNESAEYRSESNKLYWKNRKPHAAYWQQDVHYNIKAILNDPSNIIEGYEELTYYNNSPDALPFVYFHLYSNANTKDSYLADQYRNNGFKLGFGPYRNAGLGTVVESIRVNETDLATELDNTILKIQLTAPLMPGDSITFKIKFKTYFDYEVIRNRMKVFGVSGYKHFNLVQWYPRICVYDMKKGWDTDQHMDREFYGDFGSFHVELTLPNDYICDGTGILLNQAEMYPGDLRQRLDLSNFAKKPWNSAPSEIVKPDGTFKTWKFGAINAHDVAYTFDPTYRIGEEIAGSIHCIALVQEQHAIGWQNAARYTARIIDVNSKLIGPYAYPKMIVADAQEGTENVMITLDAGSDPGYRSLLIHEISHNWFYGMVGSNETYRAFMDEGLTQFYTAYGWEHIEGMNELFPNIKSKYVREHTDTVLARDKEAYLYYMSQVLRGDKSTLNTHSDYFGVTRLQPSGYSQMYMKTAVMMYNLKYVLGDSLFNAAMKNYFKQWRFCHPYPEDFRNSIIQFTHVDLNWFFDEWIETAKTLDYSIKKVKRVRGEKDQYKIVIERKGKMQMPVDFSVYTTDKSKYDFHIPNGWFVKKTDARVLPRWIGWDKVKPTYTAIIAIPKEKKISKVVLDTGNVLPDTWPVDNAKPRNVSWLNFDSKIYNPPDRNKYQTFFRPSLWYNGYDGVKVGMNLNGNYMNYKHVFDLTVWINTGAGQAYLDSGVSINSHDPVSFLFNYKNPTDRFIKKSSVYATLKELDGLSGALLGFDKRTSNDKTRFYVQYKVMLRDVGYDLNYLVYKNEWLPGLVNSYAAFGVDHNYYYTGGTGAIKLNFRAPFFSDYDFSAVTLSCVNKNYLGKVGIHTRVFAQYGYGNKLPYESMLYVAGANPEEMMDNKYVRSMGIFQPFAFGAQTNNFCYGGGLNLRGYMGYLLPQVNSQGDYRYNYKGTSGAAYNMEIDFGRCFGFLERATRQAISFSPYLFGDAGIIQTNYNYEPLAFSDVMVDAGAGAAVTINKWWKLSDLKPLTIRADFPLFLNRLPYVEKDYFMFRWMIGVSRAF